MLVTNYQSGEVCIVEFKQEGWGGRNKHALEGYTYNSLDESKAKKKVPSWMMSGTWSGSMSCQPMKPDGKKVDDSVQPTQLWELAPWPDQHEMMYYFTQFTLQLNNMPDDLRAKLPPTDSRLRPDMRELENGDLDAATVEKNRLEEKQRALRKFREENPGNDFEPHYFTKTIDADSQEEVYVYGQKRDYWADRKNQDWAHLDDLF